MRLLPLPSAVMLVGALCLASPGAKTHAPRRAPQNLCPCDVSARQSVPQVDEEAVQMLCPRLVRDGGLGDHPAPEDMSDLAGGMTLVGLLSLPSDRVPASPLEHSYILTFSK